jgi:hypothetical protein
VQLLVVKALFLRLDAPAGAQSRRSSYGPSVVIRRRRVVVVVVVGCVFKLTDRLVWAARRS